MNSRQSSISHLRVADTFQLETFFFRQILFINDYWSVLLEHWIDSFDLITLYNFHHIFHDLVVQKFNFINCQLLYLVVLHSFYHNYSKNFHQCFKINASLLINFSIMISYLIPFLQYFLRFYWLDFKLSIPRIRFPFVQRHSQEIWLSKLHYLNYLQSLFPFVGIEYQ
jgi:hypothetical protein